MTDQQGTPHIHAEQGAFAPLVLMPGDPLRAKAIAEACLSDARQVNSVRNMLAFTGSYNGLPVSVMGSGMGIPSIGIYAQELIDYYRVKKIIRIGTCGATMPDNQLGDVILAMAASTDSSINRLNFRSMDYAASADFDLLIAVYQQAAGQGFKVRVGDIFSTDSFYHPDPEIIELLQSYKVLALDMESAALYAIAKRNQAQALSVLTVSDVIPSGAKMGWSDRQNALNDVARLVLDSVAGMDAAND